MISHVITGCCLVCSGNLQIELSKTTQQRNGNTEHTHRGQQHESSNTVVSPPCKVRRTSSLFGHYRASPAGSANASDDPAHQLTKYLDFINSENSEEYQLDVIRDYPLLQPLFERLFSVPASSAPVERVFSQSGLIMSARRARMSDALLESLVFLKCNADVKN